MILAAAPALAALSFVAAMSGSTLAEELYGHRLLFDADGHPVIPLGLMQGQKAVSIECAGGMVLLVGEGRSEIAPNTRIVVERARGEPAVVTQDLIVETLEGEDRAKKRERAAAWEAKGVHVEAVDVGGVYGVKGTVVDNRAVLLVTSGNDAALVARLEKLGARPAPIERMAKPPTGGVKITMPQGILKGASVRFSSKDGAPLLVHDVEHGIGYSDHGFADRQLRGDVVVLPDKTGALAAVNLVDEDQLVAGVLPSEMFATAPLEALKAQAVTARGELFAKIGRRHFADPELVCSEQHCQVYKGVTAEAPRSTEAALATRGELAFSGGKLVDSVYSACCGGHTEAADVVWDRPAQPSLVGRADIPLTDPSTSLLGGKLLRPVPLDLRSEEAVRVFLQAPREAAFCGRSTFNQKGDAWRWQRRFTKADLDAAFADLGVGSVQRVAVDERGSGGRLRSLVVEGSAGTARVLRELPVRRRLGNLRSGLFVIDEERDARGALVAVTLHGAGFGHGSGMCQQGAIGMAEAGYDYRDILRHYYLGAEVRRVF